METLPLFHSNHVGSERDNHDAPKNDFPLSRQHTKDNAIIHETRWLTWKFLRLELRLYVSSLHHAQRKRMGFILEKLLNT